MVSEAEIEKIVAAAVARLKCLQVVYKPECSDKGTAYTGKIPDKALPYVREQETKTETEKPAHMTHLNGSRLVSKNHPVIAFRGAVDILESEIILVQMKANAMGLLSLERDLEAVKEFVHDLIRMEITGNVAKIESLCGMTDEEIHEYSHHPGQYFGIRHFVPSKAQGLIPAYLNKLRALARKTELMACAAFSSGESVGDKVERKDLIHVLNRISSLFHVMMIKYMHGDYPASMVMVEGSGRHVHLSAEDVRRLFGDGYQLTKVRELSQPGQFVCKERLTVKGPKGVIENVVVLGPERSETQVEISKTDAKALGIEPVVRQSGDIEHTPGCILENNGTEITLDKGVIVAGRHVHMHPDDAGHMQLKDGDFVDLKMTGVRGLTFHHVLVRVSDKFATYAHIDYDEANACGLSRENLGIIIKEQ